MWIQLRKYAITSLLVAGGVMAGAAVAEVGARLLFPQWVPRAATLTRIWRHDPVLGWAHRPNAEGSFSSADFSTYVTINSKGFRDAERSYERNDSRTRIVAIGDSVVWGYGVEDDEGFTHLMEARRGDLEVINLGVSGYGTDQELLLFNTEGARYRPDVVLLMVMENDFITNVRSRVFAAYEKPMFVLRDDGGLELTNSPVPEPSTPILLMTSLVRSSYVLSQVARAYDELFVSEAEPWPPPASEVTAQVDFPGADNERVTVALLRRLVSDVRAAGAEPLLVLHDALGPIGKQLQELLENEVRVLNLDAFFPDDRSGLYVDAALHWSVSGNELVADIVLEYLVSEGVIPAPGSE